jgi:hypothetical protein
MAALSILVSKGTQDAYLIDAKSGEFPFKTMYSRHRNFAQVPKKLSWLGNIQPGGSSILTLQSLGDLITGVWFEGDNLTTNLAGSSYELWIGGQMIDAHTHDYLQEIWQVFLPETQAKSDTFNNTITKTNDNFYPMHFFFCDNDMFLPLLAITAVPVEIRITWGPNVSGLTVTPYGNYIFLDTADREEIKKRPVDILITQVQKSLSSSLTNVDLSVFNHPVKAMFFGQPMQNPSQAWTFDSADLMMNGNFLLEQMSPNFFYTSQIYHHTRHGVSTWDSVAKSPKYTQYFMYSFAIDASRYKPNGSCNFSCIDLPKLNLYNPRNITGSLYIYVINYNVLRVNSGTAGVLFGN